MRARKPLIARKLRLVPVEPKDETAEAASRAGIDVTDDILHQLRRCITRGRGSSKPELRYIITEFLLMYFNVYRHKPSAMKARRKIETLRKAIERLQRALPTANDPTYRLLSDGQFAWAYYSGQHEWKEFRARAAKFDGVNFAHVFEVLESARAFVSAGEKLVGKSREKKYVGLES